MIPESKREALPEKKMVQERNNVNMETFISLNFKKDEWGGPKNADITVVVCSLGFLLKLTHSVSPSSCKEGTSGFYY